MEKSPAVDPLQHGHLLRKEGVGPGVVQPALARGGVHQPAAQGGRVGVGQQHVLPGQLQRQRRRGVRQGRQRVLPHEGRQQLHRHGGAGALLGTTGIVEPMSEQALVDTIHVELRQRRANGADYVLLTPGNYGADFIRASIGLDPRTAVLTSNFIGDALEHCRTLGFCGALLVGHIGKLVKLAGGMWNTHSKCGDCRMELIAAHAAALGLPPARVEEVLDCATCDDALRILKEEQLYDAVLARLAERIEFHLAHKCGEMAAGAIVFSKEYGLLCRTSRAQELLGTIMEG